MDDYYASLIADEFLNCVNNTIDRINDRGQTYRPFHTALLSEEVIFWSSFERSFSTSFGQRVIEELAKIVALSNGAEEAERQHITTLQVDEGQELAITEHIKSLRSGERKKPYDWQTSLSEVSSVQRAGRVSTRRIISDFWWKKNDVDNYISLKTVMPNIDQTAVAKEDCLWLSIGKPGCNAYFGLPYNPYGERKEDYNFSPPMRIFDFRHDPVVLIGREMWDTIGGDGCYDTILNIAKQVGETTRNKISNMKKF
jgi:hypothetical protein